MVVIFSRVFIGWVERWLWLTEAPELVVFTRETKTGIGNNQRREAAREIDFSATISEPLSFTYPFCTWSASPHTPASLRDISCVQKGDKTHCLSAPVGQYIHLVPIAVSSRLLYLCKLLFTGRRSLLFCSLECLHTAKWIVLRGQTEKQRHYYGKCKQMLPSASAQEYSTSSDKRCNSRGSALSKNTGACVAVVPTVLLTLESIDCYFGCITQVHIQNQYKQNKNKINWEPLFKNCPAVFSI